VTHDFLPIAIGSRVRAVQVFERRMVVHPVQARVFHCARCGKLVWICRRCDRGHRYCSPECAFQARRESTREAKSRYRNSDAGRITQKFRQRRFRSGLGADVTDQSSERAEPRETIEAPSEEVILGEHARDTPGPQPEAAGTNYDRGERPKRPGRVWKLIRCHFCGRICGVILRCDLGLRRGNQARQKGRHRRGETQEGKQVDRDA